MTTTNYGYPYQMAGDLSKALGDELVSHEVYCTTSAYHCTQCPDWELSLVDVRTMPNPLRFEFRALADRVHLADVIARTALPRFVEQMVIVFVEQSIERVKNEIKFRNATDGGYNDMGLQVVPGVVRLNTATEVLGVFLDELNDELEHRWPGSAP